MKRIITSLAFLLLAGSVYAQPVQGQRPASGGNSADDTDCAILVKAVANTGATIEVASTDLVFTTDGTTADSDVAAASGDCGATPGTLDTANAACDTVGELCDQINESSTWRCAIVDAVRADTSAKLVTMAETSGNVTDGVCIAWDTSVQFKNTRLLAPPEARKMSFYLQGPQSTQLKPNPFAGKVTRVDQCTETSTFGSGTSAFQILGSTLGLNNTTRASTEATNTYWSAKGGDTTVASATTWQPGGIWSDSGERLLARINNSAAASAINLFCSAEQYERSAP